MLPKLPALISPEFEDLTALLDPKVDRSKQSRVKHRKSPRLQFQWFGVPPKLGGMILVLAGAGKNLKSAAALNFFNSLSNLQVFAIDQEQFLLGE